MKIETKVALIQLAEAIKELAAATLLTIGMDNASSIMSKAQNAIAALNKEDTAS